MTKKQKANKSKSDKEIGLKLTPLASVFEAENKMQKVKMNAKVSQIQKPQEIVESFDDINIQDLMDSLKKIPHGIFWYNYEQTSPFPKTAGDIIGLIEVSRFYEETVGSHFSPQIKRIEEKVYKLVIITFDKPHLQSNIGYLKSYNQNQIYICCDDIDQIIKDIESIK